jgi:ATP-dependent Lon protease
VPKQTQACGLDQEKVEFADEGLLEIVQSYTREAGVRNLEREIGNICRKVARQMVVKMGDQDQTEFSKVPVNRDKVNGLLGPQKFRDLSTEKKNEVGLATGLAWTEVGGQVLVTEVSIMEGRGRLTTTGKLGDVMQESAQAAMSWVRSRAAFLGLARDFYRNLDIHVHVPEGAIPKDGPSAGITIATTIASALTKLPVRGDVAMTGEITLRGRVLPIGGVKEKLLAAHRHGVRDVIIPKDNEKDLVDVPENIRQDLKIHSVQSMDEVLRFALAGDVDSLAALAPVETAVTAVSAGDEARPAN